MDMQSGFRLGPWQVSPLTGEIESDGAAIHLEPKVMEVLVVLAESAETLVLRDQLLERVWGRRAAISDEPLTRCIAQLRQALGDSSRDPKYIQTVPKRGYRLMLPVQALPGQSVDEAAALGQPVVFRRRRPGLILPWQGIALITTIAVVGVLAFATFPLLFGPEPFQSLNHCDLESIEAPEIEINPGARTLCEQGTADMNQRTARMILRAMEAFRNAIRIDPGYGSAYFNLARAMVLLPSYEDGIPDPYDCRYDDNEPDPQSCFDGAINLLDRFRFRAQYLDKYEHGIRAYVFTKNKRYLEALGEFQQAEIYTGTDADMLQWRSQFYAAVGDFDKALADIERANELNPMSGVILDRYGVILMWLGEDEKAEEKFNEARALEHDPYDSSQLVLDIRQGRRPQVRNRLMRHAKATRIDDALWIDAFVDGIWDPSKLEAAKEAVQAAIDRNQLSGQYIYAAWAYLQDADRAIDAALNLLENDPLEMSVEFLFTQETKSLRDHDRFRDIVARLNLDDYWAEQCAPLFDQAGERKWCE